MREAANRPRGLSHKPLRSGDLILEAGGIDLSRLFQSQEPNIDGQQELADVIPKLAAKVSPAMLLDHENPVRQIPQLLLQAT